MTPQEPQVWRRANWRQIQAISVTGGCYHFRLTLYLESEEVIYPDHSWYMTSFWLLDIGSIQTALVHLGTNVAVFDTSFVLLPERTLVQVPKAPRKEMPSPKVTGCSWIQFGWGSLEWKNWNPGLAQCSYWSPNFPLFVASSVMCWWLPTRSVMDAGVLCLCLGLCTHQVKVLIEAISTQHCTWNVFWAPELTCCRNIIVLQWDQQYWFDGFEVC